MHFALSKRAWRTCVVCLPVWSEYVKQNSCSCYSFCFAVFFFQAICSKPLVCSFVWLHLSVLSVSICAIWFLSHNSWPTSWSTNSGFLFCLTKNIHRVTRWCRTVAKPDSFSFCCFTSTRWFNNLSMKDGPYCQSIVVVIVVISSSVK